MIFQDPISSLNPRRTVTQIVEEPLKIWNLGTEAERLAKVEEVLTSVGIDPRAAAERKPHEFSGGQCQRISIGRALVLDPKLIICDEPVSALDVSVQAQILNLLEDMKERYGLTLVFIAHDLAVVKNVSDRVAVMYLGKMCEISPPDMLYAAPAHPYTKALLSAIPLPDPSASVDVGQHLGGELPSPIDPPSGCRFRTRCDRAQELCSKVEPQMQLVDDDHCVACHFPLQPVAVAATPGSQPRRLTASLRCPRRLGCIVELNIATLHLKPSLRRTPIGSASSASSSGFVDLGGRPGPDPPPRVAAAGRRPGSTPPTTVASAGGPRPGPRRAVPPQLPGVPRGHARRLEGPLCVGQRQLPLRRGRARVPPR